MMRSISVTLDNVLQDVPEANAAVFEMGGPGPVIAALTCGDSIVLEHCAAALASMADQNALLAPFICQDSGAAMSTILQVLTSTILAGSRDPASLGDLDPVDESLLQLFCTVTASSALAVATLYDLQGVQAFGRLLLAPNSSIQVGFIAF